MSPAGHAANHHRRRVVGLAGSGIPAHVNAAPGLKRSAWLEAQPPVRERVASSVGAPPCQIRVRSRGPTATDADAVPRASGLVPHQTQPPTHPDQRPDSTVTPEVAGSSPVAPVPVQAVSDVLKARASARAFVLVRFGQISNANEPAQRGDEMLADLLATASGLELVDVEIHGDRRPSMSHLALHPDRVESTLRKVRPAVVDQGDGALRLELQRWEPDTRRDVGSSPRRGRLKLRRDLTSV